jgi:DNA excision repair protein ERCC-4
VFENEDLTIENALNKNFDFYLKEQLDPSKISNKTRNLLQDIKTIRRLTSYLTGYDCVTFLSFLETLIAASSPTSIFKTDTSQWLMLDAAQVVIQTAKSRVYKKKSDILEPVLEAQPKWKILMDILREITLEKQDLTKTSPEEDGPILVMVQEDRTCYQVAELLGSTGYNIVHHHPHGQHSKIIQSSRGSEFDFSSHGIECLFQRIFTNYLRWKGGLIQMKSNSKKSENSGTSEAQSDVRKGSTDHTSKRRRLRGGSNMGERKSKDLVFNIDADEIHDM